MSGLKVRALIASAVIGALLACLALLAPPRADAVPSRTAELHLGVATCGGTTCHGRQEGDGAVVRQDEIRRWQDESSQAGAHSRAWRVLATPRGRDIAQRLGLGDPQAAPACLGCHADPAPSHGGRWNMADGVGCEACHGPASAPWLASHYAVGQSHTDSVAKGLYPLDNAQARAGRCLDCHFGGTKPGQFVDHRIMAAGHPRLSFELDLFTALEQHWDEDSDYARRKGAPQPVRVWAVGQAMAIDRALALFQSPRGQAGSFAEPYFFDCHSCHRRIGDEPGYRPTALANPGRPIPPGMPPFQDENIVMLGAAARVAAPAQADGFEASARAFHVALAEGRAPALAAATRLRAAAQGVAAAFARRSFSSAETYAIIDAVARRAADRYTDYAASAQAVMALDTLTNALVRQGAVSPQRIAGARGAIDGAYKGVRDPNTYRPLEFRAALARAAQAVEATR